MQFLCQIWEERLLFPLFPVLISQAGSCYGTYYTGYLRLKTEVEEAIGHVLMKDLRCGDLHQEKVLLSICYRRIGKC